MDKLEELFRLQKSFMDELGATYTPIDIALMTLAAHTELSEMLQEIHWKPWKKTGKTNLDAAREELIDVQHFIFELAILLGMDADAFYTQYLHKMEINKARQANGY